jgi:hypothetical protein
LGLASVVMPLFVMQPAMGAVFAAARTATPWRNRLRALANHGVFGLGAVHRGGGHRIPLHLIPEHTMTLIAHPARGTQSLSARIAVAFVTALGGLLVAGCSTPPPNLDVALEKPSAAGLYRVVLVPPAQSPTVNQMHSWNVKLAATDGTPVHGARFSIDGGMPQHGHGLPTQPRVTRELGDGTYQLDGMKFSMTGWWEIKLAIQGPQGADKVTFNTVVRDPQVRP